MKMQFVKKKSELKSINIKKTHNLFIVELPQQKTGVS